MKKKLKYEIQIFSFHYMLRRRWAIPLVNSLRTCLLYQLCNKYPRPFAARIKSEVVTYGKSIFLKTLPYFTSFILIFSEVYHTYFRPIFKDNVSKIEIFKNHQWIWVIYCYFLYCAATMVLFLFALLFLTILLSVPYNKSDLFGNKVTCLDSTLVATAKTNVSLVT